MNITVALVAGRGIGEMAIRVIEPILMDPLVDHLYVLYGEIPGLPYWLIEHPKITEIDFPMRSHADLGNARNWMWDIIENESDPDWLLIGDEDGLIHPDFFRVLSELPYPKDPVLVTGKLDNANGKRYYDICAFIGTQPVAIPYDDWQNPKWDEKRYANGGQHILNRAARQLGVRYQDRDGEDPHFCWDFVKAGGRIQFEPELKMTLAKLHGDTAYPPP